MPTCLLCAQPLTKSNDSAEHLIPASIGGNLQKKGLLCQPCNSSTGYNWDAKLAIQLLPLTHLFRIVRERGPVPPISIETTAGEHFKLLDDGSFALNRPSIERKVLPEGKVEIAISARTMDEAKTIVRGLKKRHPEIDIAASLAGATSTTSYPLGMVKHSLDFGGELGGRSVIKSCLAMAQAGGIDGSLCREALAYLRSPAATACFGYYYDTDLLEARPVAAPLHCISVRANSKRGLILSYAEYYGIHRIVSLLGSAYDGPDVQVSYAIDPRNGSVLKVKVRLDFSMADLAGC